MSDARPGIDPRGPRFTAGVVAVLFLVVIALALVGGTPATLAERAVQPALLLSVFNALVFAWAAVAGVQRHPYGLVYRKLIRPRLKPPVELEDPAPPTFAQGVGLIVTVAGIVLHLLGVPYALVVAGAAAFLAAFLNSVFAYCLGCQIYLLLARAGVIRRKAAASAA
jgi:hypothetical protein